METTTPLIILPEGGTTNDVDCAQFSNATWEECIKFCQCAWKDSVGCIQISNDACEDLPQNYNTAFWIVGGIFLFLILLVLFAIAVDIVREQIETCRRRHQYTSLKNVSRESA